MLPTRNSIRRTSKNSSTTSIRKYAGFLALRKNWQLRRRVMRWRRSSTKSGTWQRRTMLSYKSCGRSCRRARRRWRSCRWRPRSWTLRSRCCVKVEDAVHTLRQGVCVRTTRLAVPSAATTPEFHLGVSHVLTTPITPISCVEVIMHTLSCLIAPFVPYTYYYSNAPTVSRTLSHFLPYSSHLLIAYLFLTTAHQLSVSSPIPLETSL